jgi:hypothetical protein
MKMSLLDRSWVHKRLSSNVFIGEPSSRGAQEFATISGFPQGHELYSDSVCGLSASGYLIEVARQANLAICHRFFDVALEAAFLVTAIDWQFEGEEPFVVTKLAPFEVVTQVLETQQRKGALARLVTRTSFFSEQKRFLTGGASFLISSARHAVEKSKLRPAAEPACAPLRPDAVQVKHPRNVLVGAPEAADLDANRIPMLVDPRHPFFFEHENAHVPGMMLLEAGKQAAVFAAKHAFPILNGTYADLHSGEIRFGRFADLHRQIFMNCHFSPVQESARGFRLPTEIVFEQGGVEIGHIRGALSFLALDDAIEMSALLRRPAGEAPPSSRHSVQESLGAR